MATSGSFNTSAYSNRHLVFSWSGTQSTANNTTTISWTLKGAGSYTGYYMAAPFKVIIDGETVYSSSTRIELRSGTSVASGSKTIKHNADGSRKFSASVSAAIYSYSENVSGSGTWSLDAIPRAATITSAPNFNDEANPVLQYSNLAGSSVTSLQACISLDGSAASIAYRDISKTGTSYTFSLTTAERETLRNATTTSNYRNVYFMVKTVIGGNTYTNKIKKQLTIINCMPTLSPTIVDSNTTTKNVTGDANILVKGLSNATVTTNVKALKGATIKSQTITCGSKKLTNSGTISKVESGTFNITAVDSRGNTVTQTVTKTLVNYFTPTIYVTSTDISTDGKVTVTISGSAFTGTIGKTNNKSSTKVIHNYIINDGEYESMTAQQSVTFSGNNFSVSISYTNFDYQKTYKFNATVTDALSNVTGSTTAMGRPVLEWGKDYFAIFADKTEGNYYGLGRLTQIASGENLDNYKEAGVYGVKSSDIASGISNIPVAKSGKLIVSSSLGMGMTGVDAYITQEYIPMDLKYPTYKRRIHTSHTSSSDWTYTDWIRQSGAVVLWSGAKVMVASDSILLPEAIANQPTGIILRFCGYADGAKTSTHFMEFFISKDFIASYGGKGHNFDLTQRNFSAMGCKYIYMNDVTNDGKTVGKITGHDGNDDSGTASATGIPFNNAVFCLTEVIGV